MIETGLVGGRAAEQITNVNLIGSNPEPTLKLPILGRVHTTLNPVGFVILAQYLQVMVEASEADAPVPPGEIVLVQGPDVASSRDLLDHLKPAGKRP